MRINTLNGVLGAATAHRFDSGGEQTVTIGAKLKELRIKNNKSLQEVADAVGISKAHVWNLEKGESANPSMEVVVKLAGLFKVSVSDLVGENPNAADEKPELVALYRELKALPEADRKMIEVMVEQLKARKGA
jgi:transcriptional regulator with XRE-family HTH domain